MDVGEFNLGCTLNLG